MTQQRVRLRPEIASAVPYRQGKPASPDSYKLSSNENPSGPIPAVLEAIASSSVNRYPDAAAAELRSRLATRFDVDSPNVHIGAGSVSILSQLIAAAAGPGDEVLYAWRSFEAYPGLVLVSGASSVQVPNAPDHRHDLSAMAAAITDRTRLVLVCTPNNPTSTIVTAAEFERFMAAVPESVLVVLDEAYVEFVTDVASVNGARELLPYPNLVVLRTFSKAYGLAGLRVGYAIGPEYILDAARASGIPLSVTEPAQRAAIASLDHEPEVLARVPELIERRDRVWQALTGQGWDVPQPHGNFVWLPTGTRTAEANEVLERHGIVARALGEGIRVSIGEEGSVDKLLTASAEVVANLRSTH